MVRKEVGHLTKSALCAKLKSKTCSCKYESSCFTSTHRAWVKTVYERFKRLYLLNPPFGIGSGYDYD